MSSETQGTYQYTVRLDPVIYGRATSGFTRADWVALALAALDQAGLNPAEYDRLVVALPSVDREELLDAAIAKRAALRDDQSGDALSERRSLEEEIKQLERSFRR